jgi:ATP synthase protein I
VNVSQPQPLVNAKPAVQLLKGQLMVAVIVSLLALVWGQKLAYSAAIGALIALLASAYFAWEAFRFSGAMSSARMLSGFYRGIIGKFLLVIMGFVAVQYAGISVSMVALFVGFVVVQAVVWLAPLLWSA